MLVTKIGSYLLKHAIRNVWCSPSMDFQSILKLSRISPPGHYRDYFDYQWRRIPLPTSNQDYHVYGIGNNVPIRLAMKETYNTWVPLANLGQLNANLIELYLSNGLMLSRSHAFVIRIDEGSFLVAVAIQPRLADIDNNDIYMRTYRNAYYSSERDVTGPEKVIVKGLQVKTAADVPALINEFQRYKQLPYGHVFAYHNGYIVDTFRQAEIKSGDYIEFVYDASVKEVVDFKLEYLPTFTSDLDKKQKYLLHPPKRIDTIQYRDDLDFYVIRKGANGAHKGKYYNRNRENAIRMVTHRDWALLCEQVKQIYDGESSWENYENLYIRVHMRHSGYYRELADEHNRIKELYKLNDTEIVRAMVGLDSTVPNWTVNTLESSSYTRIMRSYLQNITEQEVARAYGYNAMTKITADSPIMMRGGKFDIPIGLEENSTVFEYDHNGLLLGWRLHYGGDVYYPFYRDCVMIEVLGGLGSRLAGFQLSTGICKVSTDESFRVYVSPINVNGVPTNDWADITDDRTKYSVDAYGNVSWNIDHAGQIGVIKSDKYFVCYDYDIEEYNHLYRFSLNHSDQDPRVMHIPPGRIDIWMNGKALIENMDFKVNYPEVVIWNKEYLRKSVQKFTIRAYGFANSDLSRTLSPERGYVKHQMLSVNNVYDIRDDKVMRIVSNGRTFHRSVVKFAEDQRNISLPDLNDGRPYLIEPALVPIRGVVNYNTYPYLQKSLDTDKAVSDYLTSKLPEQLPSTLHSIPERYMIYSPTMGRLVYDLGQQLKLPLAPEAPEAEVAKFMEPYLWLLDFDPCRVDEVDLRYTAIHPHPQAVVLAVTKYTYLFLQRINVLYLNERVNLAAFLMIEGEGETIPEIPEIPEIPDPDPEPLPPPTVRVDMDSADIATPKITTASIVSTTPPVTYERRYLISAPFSTVTVDTQELTYPTITVATMKSDPVIKNIVEPINASPLDMAFTIDTPVINDAVAENVFGTAPAVESITLRSTRLEINDGLEDRVTQSTPTMTFSVNRSGIIIDETDVNAMGVPAITIASITTI